MVQCHLGIIRQNVSLYPHPFLSEDNSGVTSSLLAYWSHLHKNTGRDEPGRHSLFKKYDYRKKTQKILFAKKFVPLVEKKIHL